MAIDKRITMKPDRGLVKYVKIKKKRDNKLEKDFQQVIKDEESEIHKNINLSHDVQNATENLDTLQKIANELTLRKKKCENRITEAKDKLAVEEQKFQGAKVEKDRKVSNARQEIFARAQAKSELEVEEIEKLIKETNETITKASERLETKRAKLAESNARAEALLKTQQNLQEQGAKLADEDFTDITDVMEKLRKTEKYKQIVPISQTADEYVFMLVQPEEYVGDPVSVEIKPVKPNNLPIRPALDPGETA